MDLQMNDKVAEEYSNKSQKIRVITENWVSQNLFCPYCGNAHIRHFENNRPVADFYCPSCLEEYELKSKHTAIHNKVADGAYDTMLGRINSINNPNFFFLHYNKADFRVKNFVMVPKHFFVPDIIEKRNPLANTARRAGWVGCNILLKGIPDEGRIYIVKDEMEQPVDKIVSDVKKMDFVKQYELEARGWIFDILKCVNSIGEEEFTLNQMYQFTHMLELKHPENHHIEAKIRQQLQLLRDEGIIEFVERGHYKKVKQCCK
ncbi:MAG: restriction endonuclease [Lachnospiraceae bacterium]|nr:restriction endonuclease [Lachnospiraceae bacterium]